jgi:two-component system, cell cycle sensor histidine kinase and response regulator CckA
LNLVKPGERLYPSLQEIHKAVLRSTSLTRQLLAFARKQTASPKVLDLNDIISNMLKMLRRLIGEDIKLTWRPGHDLWQVKIDPSQIDQILANLLVNARDAISNVGSVNLETENIVMNDSCWPEQTGIVPGKYVLMTVSDSGTGMSKEILDQIFEPFFTTKEVGKGTGLGLATVYGIVRQNNGFIDVQSELGKGTTFKIYLPRFETETLQESAEEPVSGQQTGTETILVVEDDEGMLKLTKTVLESLGYTVIAKRTPKEAIRFVENHAGDLQLLLTDLVMPEMNGRELAERLRIIRTGLKSLYMSGYTANVIVHQGVLEDGVHFIQKPFTMGDLAGIIREVLEPSPTEA